VFLAAAPVRHKNMAETDIPEAAAALLRERVHTFEELEALVFVYRGRVDAWGPNAIATTLKLPLEATEEALIALGANGLLVTETGEVPRWRYGPATPDLDEAAAMLVRAYGENRLGIVKRMSDNAIHRMRTGAMRAFSEAFVLGRKKRDG
jgi:hypothetical protein